MDIARQAEVEQVRGAEVDGDGQPETFVAPARTLAEGVVEHAQGQRAHQARLLGERQEGARAEQAELRVIPAHERLGAGDLAGLEIELRLVVHDDLTGLDRVRQLADQGETGAGMAVAGRAVDLMADAARLGGVHGDIGALHQRLDVAPVLGEHRDADAGADQQRQALEAERLLDRARERDRDRLGLVDRGPGREQHGELVTADAGHELGAGNGGLEPRPDLAQEPVARPGGRACR